MFPYMADKSRWLHKSNGQYKENCRVLRSSVLSAALAIDRSVRADAGKCCSRIRPWKE